MAAFGGRHARRPRLQPAVLECSGGRRAPREKNDSTTQLLPYCLTTSNLTGSGDAAGTCRTAAGHAGRAGARQ